MTDAAGREYSDYTVNEQRAYLKGAEDQKLVMEALSTDRLRDAAPDLLEQLIELVGLIEHAWPSLAQQAPLKAASAAIARATGK